MSSINFGIYTNVLKDAGLETTQKIIKILEDRNIQYFLNELTCSKLNKSNVLDFKNIDVLLVVGGDGTILSAVKECIGHNIKILGINLGRKGFLLDIDKEYCEEAIDRVLRQEYEVEQRMMLLATIKSEGKTLRHAYALNDIVLSKGKDNRIVNIKVHVNNKEADDLYCDGIIVTSPTGSTGYSLSAGGCVMIPTLNAIAITPICAHTLNARCMVICSHDEVRMVCEKSECMVLIDGQIIHTLKAGDSLHVAKSQYNAEFIKFSEVNFFEVLKNKLSEWTIR